MCAKRRSKRSRVQLISSETFAQRRKRLTALWVRKAKAKAVLQALTDEEPEVSGLMPELKTLYNKELLKRLLPVFTYQCFGRKPLAPKLGTTVQFRKFNPQPAQVAFFEKAA